MKKDYPDLESSFSDTRDHTYTEWEKSLGEKPAKKWLEKQREKQGSNKQ